MEWIPTDLKIPDRWRPTAHLISILRLNRKCIWRWDLSKLWFWPCESPDIIFHRFPSNYTNKNIPTSSWNCQIMSKISCVKSAGVCPKTQTQLPGISRHFVGHNSLLDLQLWFVSEGKYKIDTFIVYLWFWQYKKNFSFVTHALETKFARRNYIFFLIEDDQW